MADISTSILITYVNTQWGILRIEVSSVGLRALTLVQRIPEDHIEVASEHLGKVVIQIKEYFAGTRKIFDLEYDLEHHTDFHKKVWAELLKIPYGEKISYGELAKRIGDPKASQAVGNANGKNPIAIIIPCHRVIGSDGSLTGYASGIDKKRWLLMHELDHSPVPYGQLF